MAPWQNAREVQKIRGPNIDPKQQHPPSKYALNHVETYPQHKEPHLKNNVKKMQRPENSGFEITG